MSDIVFEQVVYHISETLDVQKREQLSQVLDARGAQKAEDVTDPDLTHFITSSLPLEDFVEQLPPHSRAHTVTPLWVERSFVLGSQQDPEFFSADPAYLFSGVTATATDLSAADCELMSAAITAMGGQWRTALTRDVTHLFALAKGSAKYETAMHYREQMNVCVLVPHWFDDTVRLGIRDLPTRKYEWPEPAVFGQRLEGRTSQEDVDYEPTKERMMLYDTVDVGRRPQEDATGGREVTKAAGRVQEELAKMEETDIYVTRYRTGAAYAKAYKLEKTIGTLAWLWYVRASGKLSRPADQLLHYPIPDSPASGFEKEVVTVTNYTGKDREYLKKLITLMGGEFTASMSAEKNSIVVAAYLQGTKTDKAASWSIPIVNHTWVEDASFNGDAHPARDKYILFLLASTSASFWHSGARQDRMGASPRKQKNHKARDDLRPVGTLQSVGEVEDAIAMDEGADMDVDPTNRPWIKPSPRSRQRNLVKRKLVRRVSRKPENDSEEQRPTTPDTSPKRPSRTTKPQRLPPRTRLESPTTSRKLQTARRKVLPRDEESSAEEEVPKTKSKARAKPAAPAPSTENKEQVSTKKHKVVHPPSDSDSDFPMTSALSRRPAVEQQGQGTRKACAEEARRRPCRCRRPRLPPIRSEKAKRRHPRLSRWDLRRPHRKRQRRDTGPRKIKKTAALEAEKEHGDHASTTESPYKVGRTPRGAATKAAQKLHDVVMPDVLSYQKEVKSGTVRATHERDGGASTSLPAKGKKRPSMGSAGPESEEEDEIAQPEKKKRKAGEVENGGAAPGKGKRRRKSGTDADATRSEDEQPAPKAAQAVRVMTQLVLGDDVTKVGYVVSCEQEAAREDQFAVKDGDTEKKYDFKLTDALTLYPVAYGADLGRTRQSLRDLEPRRCVDLAALVKHHPIYNQELILTKPGSTDWTSKFESSRTTSFPLLASRLIYIFTNSGTSSRVNDQSAGGKRESMYD
ncbi:uncharacterized protein BXZ73DRAFT_82326 [Epithele typhae]|uniref:uncharacterized protein n=1 Tax=Epithele typhae TaxID=378194 RepID=UPI002007D7DC|nr:uncharacterized protein BXZ73DRAFT_82326 [Epithele typhae]KAH9912491.1 hypothetical protein BXZ73DRAFT_82326 [Epithele typhae]